MIGDVLRGLKRAFVFEVSRDAGRAEGVIADLGLDAGVGCAALNHAVGILLVHGITRERASLPDGRAEQGSIVVVGDPGGGNAFIADEFSNAAGFVPLHELAGGIQVRLAHVLVADLSGEEFENAHRGFGRWCEEPGRKHGGARGGDKVVAHVLTFG
jgi:hypothetical protein